MHRFWIATVLLSTAFFFASPAGADELREGPQQLVGPVGAVELSARTFRIDDETYHVPRAVAGLEAVRPGAVVEVEYVEVNARNRVLSLKLLR